MKNLKSFIAIPILLAAYVCCNGNDWVMVKIDSCASIKMPGQPLLSKDSDNERTLIYIDSGFVYSFTRIENVGTGLSSSMFCDAYVQGISEAHGAKNVVIEKFKLYNFEGKRFSGESREPDGTTFIVGRILMVNDTLYSYNVVSYDSDEVLTAKSWPFLESFTLKFPSQGFNPYRPWSKHIPAVYGKVFRVVLWIAVLLTLVIIGWVIYNKLRPK